MSGRPGIMTSGFQLFPGCSKNKSDYSETGGFEAGLKFFF